MSLSYLASTLLGAPHPSNSVATPSLPTEIWTMIFDFSISVPIFFDARWDNEIFTPFDESSQPLSPQETYRVSLNTKKAILLVCKRWNAIARGILLRQLVIRRKDQLISLVDLLEASVLDVHGSGVSCTPLGWHVTHVKLLVTTNDAISKAKVTNLARRFVVCCPRLVSLQDAAPYGLHELPLAYVTDPSSSALPKRLQSLVWSYSGPGTEDFEGDTCVLKQISSLQCTTIHLPPSPADLDSFISITLPGLLSLDLSISWNNHLPWQFAAEHLSFPSLRHLTIRAPAPGDGVLTPESVRSLDAFLEAHGKTLGSLDIHISPRATARTTLLFHDGTSMENVVDIGAILARCPNLVDIALSARWLSADVPTAATATVAGEGDVSERHPIRWQHAKLERVGLRDVDVGSSSSASGWGSDVASPVSRPASLVSSVPDQAFEMLTAYQRSTNFFEWSIETLLQSGSLGGVSRRHQSFAATMRALLETRDIPAWSSYAPGVGTLTKEMLFPTLRTVRLLDANLDSLMTEQSGPTEDGEFWEKWHSAAKQRGISIDDCRGSPIVNRYGPGRS
jgi:hypothetical protein